MPTKVWVPGEEVISDDFNAMVQEQVIPTFANASERDSKIPLPHVGQYCYQTDIATLLQFTDKSVSLATGAAAPGWHKPWDLPWGLVFARNLPDQSFGGWQWWATAGYLFPHRNRAYRVKLSTWMYKVGDGGDAHCVLRAVCSDYANNYVVVQDQIATLHPGWISHMSIEHFIPANIYGGMHWQGTCNWGTWSSGWAFLWIEDAGPNPQAALP
jgi:hypothetical protein